jgi:hypothetical protein
MTAHAMPTEPEDIRGSGGERVRDEMVRSLIKLARAAKVPRGAMASMSAAKNAIEAIDKQREWDLSLRDRDPEAFLRRMFADPRQARAFLVAMLERLDEAEAPRLPEVVRER